jgi:uncharacterized protein
LQQDSLSPQPYKLESSAVAEFTSGYARSLADSDAEPLPVFQPVTQQERIPTIDVVRGAALMGILLMNISGFSGPLEMYINPLMVGNHRTYNLAAWVLRWILFEGKMRAMFSMLFGAGVILLTERAARRGNPNIADIFLRRNMWLMLFGILHCYFVWTGDILFWYGLTALLFLYPCRKVRPRNLFIAGLLILVVGMGSDAFYAIDQSRTRDKGVAAQIQAAAGKKLNADQQAELKKWNETVEKRKKDHDDDLKAMRGSYLDQLKERADYAPKVEADYYYMFGFTDVLGMMLIGMGLYRTGFLTGKLSTSVYGWTILIGFLLSLPLNGIQAWGLIKDNFQPESSWWVVYQLSRITGALANVAVVVLVAKSGAVPWLTRRVAAVGQTALSNYLFTSILCTLLFNGFGLGYYGKLEYYQLYAVVACVWALNLWLSPLWLRHFQFGPMEWVWRSLTYWRRQPMRRQAEREAPVAA